MATIDTAAGTIVFDDIPDFTSDEGVSFEARFTTSDRTYDVATGHATLTASAIVGPTSNLLCKNIELKDLRLSTKTVLDHRSFEGFGLDHRRKWFGLVGSGTTSQGRFQSADTGIFDDLDGLT